MWCEECEPCDGDGESCLPYAGSTDKRATCFTRPGSRRAEPGRAIFAAIWTGQATPPRHDAHDAVLPAPHRLPPLREPRDAFPHLHARTLRAFPRFKRRSASHRPDGRKARRFRPSAFFTVCQLCIGPSRLEHGAATSFRRYRPVPTAQAKICVACLAVQAK